MSGQLPAQLQPTTADPLVSFVTTITNSNLSTEPTTGTFGSVVVS